MSEKLTKTEKLSLNNNELKNKLYNSRQKANRSEMKVMCDYPNCGKRFRDTYELKSHIWRHTGKKLFRCDWPGCQKEVSSKCYLKKHQLSHLDSKPYNCLFDNCCQMFATNDELSQHFVDEHNGQKPFPCDWPECGHQFTNKANLKQHFNWSHSNISFQCVWPGIQHFFHFFIINT